MPTTTAAAAAAAPVGSSRTTRRMQAHRPYQKGDITVEDQLKYQQKLLDAAGRYSAFNRENLHIIAVSVENKCFVEAKTRKEYKRLICRKLREWDYTDFSADDEDEDDGPETSNSNDELYQSVARLSRSTTNVGSFSIYPQLQHKSQPRQQRPSISPPASASTSNTSSHPTRVARRPRSHGSARCSPPNAQSFPKPTPVALPTPPQYSPLTPTPPPSFAHLFDPGFLSQIDLNDPNNRDQWIHAVWEHFLSGGTPAVPCSSMTSQSSSFSGASGLEYQLEHSLNYRNSTPEIIPQTRELDMSDLMCLRLDAESSGMLFFDNRHPLNSGGDNTTSHGSDWDMVSAGFPPEMLSLQL